MAEHERPVVLPSSVLAGLTPFEWSTAEAIGFEVAQDTIGVVIACCTGLIDRERAQAHADATRMQAWDDQITLACATQNALPARDPDAVRAVQHRYQELLARLRGHLDE